jgi:hypothetical protein
VLLGLRGQRRGQVLLGRSTLGERPSHFDEGVTRRELVLGTIGPARREHGTLARGHCRRRSPAEEGVKPREHRPGVT